MSETLSTSKVAVVRTRLPYMDRRALSEAWFSALHLASDGPPAGAFHERRGATPLPDPARTRTSALAGAVPSSAARARFGPPDTAGSGRVLHPESRWPPPAGGRAARARAAAATFTRARSYPPFRSSLTVGLERQRVQLLLRREGATLHVVALCSAGIAEVVQRALACADAHLRARGESVRSSVKTVAAGGTVV